MMALLLAAPAAQDMGGFERPGRDVPVKERQYVSYAGEPQVVAAGRRGVLELRFRVNEGFHVNSHRPASEMLLPTVVEFAPSAGVKLEAAEYPAGQAFHFSFDPGEKLDVYAGSFVVKVPVAASAGEHEVTGSLKYQACDRAACYPPKTLGLRVVFSAK